MIDEIVKIGVKTASGFLGSALGYNNEERRENITKKTESFLNKAYGGFKAIFDDMEKDLDTILCEKNKNQH